MAVKVGDRVMVGGHPATVRYVGVVTNHAGHWVGVEWDDPERGKHNGVVDGVRYFQTRFERGGSFVKIQNVTCGVDLLTAILRKYADAVDENVFMVSSKAVELVGMQSTSSKQSNIFLLKHIALESGSVAGPPPDSCALFKRCITLNLFNNLLSRWEDIQKILHFFPKLRELVLRKNRLEAAELGDSWQGVDFLKDLVLSECYLSSESIFNVLCYLPSVKNLYAFGNGLTHFQVPEVAAALTSLDIGNNPIGCFSKISGRLDNLEKLSVASCGIVRVLLEDGQFPALSVLNIKDNMISDWESINQLRKIPRLSTLYIDCENLQCLPGIGVHEVVVAKLANLVDLNRFDVSAVERQSAEVRFLDKYFCADKSEREQHKNDIDRLEKIHGAIAVIAESRGLDVLPLSICFGNEIVKKKVPMAITVQKLTEMVGRVFSVGSLNTRLVLDKGTHEVELENPLRPLNFYSPEPNDVLRLIAV